MTCTWPWSAGSSRGAVRASRRTSKSRSTYSTLTGTRSKYDAYLHEALCTICTINLWVMMSVMFLFSIHTSIGGTADVTKIHLPAFLSCSGLHQFGQRGAQRQRISLFRPLPQQRPSLEWDGQAAHSYRSFQRVPPTLWVQTLLQWVSNAAQWQSSLSTWDDEDISHHAQTCTRCMILWCVFFQLKTKERKNCLVLPSLPWWERMGLHCQMRAMSSMYTRYEQLLTIML